MLRGSTTALCVAPADLVAADTGGASAGSDRTLQTLPEAPAVHTSGTSAVTAFAATLEGTVNPRGAAVSECRFEYGTSAFFEGSVPCAALPGAGREPVTVSARLEGLAPNTEYTFRLVAANGGPPPAHQAGRPAGILAGCRGPGETDAFRRPGP